MIPPQLFINYEDYKVIINDFNAFSLLLLRPHIANKVY